MSSAMKGVVKWFNDAKGFGFIEHTSGKDVFVHYSVIESQGFKTLKEGEEVSYEIQEGPKGLHAVKVHKTNEESGEELAFPSDGNESSTLSDADDDLSSTPPQSH